MELLEECSLAAFIALQHLLIFSPPSAFHFFFSFWKALQSNPSLPPNLHLPDLLPYLLFPGVTSCRVDIGSIPCEKCRTVEPKRLLPPLISCRHCFREMQRKEMAWSFFLRDRRETGRKRSSDESIPNMTAPGTWVQGYSIQTTIVLFERSLTYLMET